MVENCKSKYIVAVDNPEMSVGDMINTLKDPEILKTIENHIEKNPLVEDDDFPDFQDIRMSEILKESNNDNGALKTQTKNNKWGRDDR